MNTLEDTIIVYFEALFLNFSFFFLTTAGFASNEDSSGWKTWCANHWYVIIIADSKKRVKFVVNNFKEIF